jgi:hypothetical protein
MQVLAAFLRNFTTRDLAATSFAFLIGSLFLVVPGYVFGYLLDSFEFNRRSTPARIAISLCLSVSVVPITLYYNWRFLPEAPWLLCGVTWAFFPLLLFWQKSSISAAECASISTYVSESSSPVLAVLTMGAAGDLGQASSNDSNAHRHRSRRRYSSWSQSYHSPQLGDDQLQIFDLVVAVSSFSAVRLLSSAVREGTSACSAYQSNVLRLMRVHAHRHDREYAISIA